jgi:homoserine O-acetyltransferase/O-succinyltransferase
MGGMAALEYALCNESGYVRNLIPIATAVDHSAWGIAWADTQRQCILLDKYYRQGHYPLSPEGQPAAGLATARKIAMLTYRSAWSFEQRFGRRLQRPQSPQKSKRMDSPQQMDESSDARPSDQAASSIDGTKEFATQRYMRYQGEKFVQRFDANCYLHLLDKLDSHDITRGRHGCSVNESPDETLNSIFSKAPDEALVVGVASDGLFMPSEQARLAKCLPQASLHMLQSQDGHDGFLLQFDELNDLIVEYLRRRCGSVFDAGLDMLEDVSQDAVVQEVSGSVGEEW